MTSKPRSKAVSPTKATIRRSVQGWRGTWPAWPCEFLSDFCGLRCTADRDLPLIIQRASVSTLLFLGLTDLDETGEENDRSVQSGQFLHQVIRENRVGDPLIRDCVVGEHIPLEPARGATLLSSGPALRPDGTLDQSLELLPV